jgi:phosphatidylglycerophosphate synthase
MTTPSSAWLTHLILGVKFLYSGTRMLLAEKRKRGRNATAAKSLK